MGRTKKSTYPFTVPNNQIVQSTLYTSDKTLVGVITCTKEKTKWILYKLVKNELVKMKTDKTPATFSEYFYKNYNKSKSKNI